MGKHFTQWEREEIERLNKEGLSHREIGEQMGYERMQIKEYFHRLNRRGRKALNLSAPKRKGRPRTTPLTQEKESELRIRELEREVAMLRSFLHAAGRR